MRAVVALSRLGRRGIPASGPRILQSELSAPVATQTAKLLDPAILKTASGIPQHAVRPSAETASAPRRVPLPLEPRRSFPLPTQVPSWYAGHMYRAMRSMPALLARDPPPIIIEARDARLPISSINPAFEELLASTGRLASQKGSTKSEEEHRIDDLRAWRRRRLIVYNKADLVDQRLHEPLKRALAEHEGRDDNVMLLDSRDNAGVRKILTWIKERAAELDSIAAEKDLEEQDRKDKKSKSATGRLSRSAQPRRLSGAFRPNSVPFRGIRLVILGMPNVGKSSMLNALRRVGTGGGKAASTAPEPGHTRKLTGTVRITPKIKKEHDEEGEEKWGQSSPSLPLDDSGIYVYDTPGVMVPFLGSGKRGAEKGVKLAAAAGIKSSLFDAIGLADYLLYRMNLQWAWRWREWDARGREGEEPLPAYLTGLPMGKPESPTGEGGMAWGPTNDIYALLNRLALRAPGTLYKGGVRDLDSAAKFMLERWRNGKLGSGELDLECFEEQEPATTENSSQNAGGKHSLTAHIRERIKSALTRHYDELDQARQAGAATSFQPVKGADRASRRAMEKLPWQELQAQHFAEQEKRMAMQAKAEENQVISIDSVEPDAPLPALDDESQADSTAIPISDLLSKHQLKRRQRSIALIIRENRLREQGVAVRGLLPANRLKKLKSHRGRHARRELRGTQPKT